MSRRPPPARPGVLFWTLWSVTLGLGALALGWFSHAGMEAVLASQVRFLAGGPAVRAELPAGTSTVFYEYDGPPHSERHPRALPTLACSVRVVQTGVEVPVRASTRLDSYTVGNVTGVSLLEVEVRSAALHEVSCRLARVFVDRGPVRLVLGHHVTSDVTRAQAGPWEGFLALVGVLVGILWRRLKG